MNSSFVKLGLALALSGLTLSVGPVAYAQAKSKTTIADIALYQGADRQERLIEGAKKEGELVLYGSLPTATMASVIDAFTKKYGIKVKPWRSGSEAVLQKVMAEQKAGRFTVDVVENNSIPMEALHRNGQLEKVYSPYQRDILQKAMPAHLEWAAYDANVYVQAYNTQLIKKEDLPKSYQDLLDPKWKGKLGIEVDDHDWFAGVMHVLGQEKGEKLFKDIIDTNGMSVRKGHTLLGQMVASGEVPLGLTLLSFTPGQLKKKGAPIEMFIIPPAITEQQAVGILKKAPNPHAAILFYDFLLSEPTQRLLAEHNIVPLNTKVDTPWKDVQMEFVNPAEALDNVDKWTKVYEDIVTKRAR